MAAAKGGHLGAISLFDHPRGGAGGHDVLERSAIEAFGPGKIRPRRKQNRAAIFNILADIIEIDRRQNAASPIAVKNDQVKIIDLFQEKLARRKGDKRQFPHRHAVLFFRRAQDGEMHKVDRAVGFQKIAPCARAGMRLTRDQKHAQAIAHAVDLDQRCVVAIGKFARRGGGGELQHVAPAMRQGQRQVNRLAKRDLKAARLCPVDRDIKRHGRDALGAGAFIGDGQRHAHLFAKNGKGGGVFDP